MNVKTGLNLHVWPRRPCGFAISALHLLMLKNRTSFSIIIRDIVFKHYMHGQIPLSLLCTSTERNKPSLIGCGITDALYIVIIFVTVFCYTFLTHSCEIQADGTWHCSRCITSIYVPDVTLHIWTAISISICLQHSGCLNVEGICTIWPPQHLTLVCRNQWPLQHTEPSYTNPWLLQLSATETKNITFKTVIP